MMNRDGRAVYTQYESLLRALVSHRRLEQITAPVLTRACAVELGDQVGSLKVGSLSSLWYLLVLILRLA